MTELINNERTSSRLIEKLIIEEIDETEPLNEKYKINYTLIRDVSSHIKIFEGWNSTILYLDAMILRDVDRKYKFLPEN
jgi:hypothetical protein